MTMTMRPVESMGIERGASAPASAPISSVAFDGGGNDHRLRPPAATNAPVLHIVGAPSWHEPWVHCHTVQLPSEQHESSHACCVSAAATMRIPRHACRCATQSHSGVGGSGGVDGGGGGGGGRRGGGRGRGDGDGGGGGGGENVWHEPSSTVASGS
jgi:hypothetical protein